MILCYTKIGLGTFILVRPIGPVSATTRLVRNLIRLNGHEHFRNGKKKLFEGTHTYIHLHPLLRQHALKISYLSIQKNYWFENWSTFERTIFKYPCKIYWNRLVQRSNKQKNINVGVKLKIANNGRTWLNDLPVCARAKWPLAITAEWF